MTMSPEILAIAACIMIGAGGLWLWLQYSKGHEQHKHMDALLEGPKETDVVQHTRLPATHWHERLANEASAWLDTVWGRSVVAQEDKALLVQCGYQTSQSSAYFLLARIAGLLILPLSLVLCFSLMSTINNRGLYLLAAAIIGFLIPKWFLRSRAKKRRKQAAKELPTLVDLLGLLQGSGLGVDQSFQLMARDFRAVMPVLTGELDMVNRLHASGRTREQALHRMSEMFQSDSLADLAALIVQIDKHGGAVQEPLRQFGERLSEQRRMRMKEDIGKITVKMTVVMILTLLPSLLIITAGPGFLSVIRALGNMT